ncbi:hypothetical protein F9278_01215 [Streptomyces phaeolivaceus]|uniref:Uncharacterized protein n=1 Tax=Streptomyces phaeolivaceus TaxID=2653200 RepID=A0A5P8JX20_9ACTN|nr:hypothetical protein [Streptomyces phaeolivaceus]QFQ95038.1 hypothetical protein F9278_01215 [Streptomyces phaeolivaceus]
MTATPSETTDLKAQYTAQVSADLERNAKEQDRLREEIAALQDQLRGLQQDQSVLANMQQALGVLTPEPVTAEPQPTPTPTPTPAPSPEEAAAPSVPRQKTSTTSSPTGRRTRAKKPAAPQDVKKAKKPVAAKSTTAKADAAKATPAKPANSTTATATGTGKKTQPTLVELIRVHLTEQSGPHSAAEVATALTQAHPDRRIQTNVVRTTLEGLVAKSNAQRTRQGSSVYYTAPDPQEPATPLQAPSESQSEPEPEPEQAKG